MADAATSVNAMYAVAVSKVAPRQTWSGRASFASRPTRRTPRDRLRKPRDGQT